MGARALRWGAAALAAAAAAVIARDYTLTITVDRPTNPAEYAESLRRARQEAGRAYRAARLPRVLRVSVLNVPSTCMVTALAAGFAFLAGGATSVAATALWPALPVAMTVVVVAAGAGYTTWAARVRDHTWEHASEEGSWVWRPPADALDELARFLTDDQLHALEDTGELTCWGAPTARRRVALVRAFVAAARHLHTVDPAALDTALAARRPVAATIAAARAR